MRKFNIFNFLEKKVDNAEITAYMSNAMNELAFKELALHIAISYIANTLSKCEFKVYKDNKEVKDVLYYRLNVSPNPNENSSKFINKFIEEYFYQGEALVIMNKNYLYAADGFHLDDANPLNEFKFEDVTLNNYQFRRPFKASDVLYFKLDNKDVKALVDSVYLQYGEVIGTALKAFKKTNGTKYKLLLEQYRAGDPAFVKIFNDVIQKDLKTFIENDNAVYPQYKGLELQEFSSKNPQNTSDIISMRKEIFEVVAQAFKIPLSMMYGNITNMNEIVKVYLSFCIDPLADMISEEMTRKCFTFSEWEKGCYVKVDTSCINHVDILEVADKLSYAIGSGAVTIDDLRNRIDLPELDNEFSKKHFITKNYAPAEDMANPMETMKGGE